MKNRESGSIPEIIGDNPDAGGNFLDGLTSEHKTSGKASRKNRRLTKPVSYGEPGGHFFNPETLRKIKKRGQKPVDLVRLMAAEGLHVIPERRDLLFEILCSEQYGLGGILKRTPQGNISFPSKMVFEVANAIELSNFDITINDVVRGGIDNLVKLDRLYGEGFGKSR